MKRRLVIATLVFGGLVAAPSAASAHHGYWACVGTYHIDFGVCVGNPLPEELPKPGVPPVPPG